MTDRIYLDYAATAPVSDTAFAAALPYYKDIFYNPSSAHALGQLASSATERAREKCATAIGARADEIYFTSGGTEAINWAFSSVSDAEGKHIVLSAIEHDAAIACAENLRSRGFSVDYVRPDADGIVTADALEAVLRDDTALVCVMTVNNIVGSVQPIKELCAAAHRRGALFFTDAVQAMNALDIDVSDSGVDMLAVSGHKLYAPKGVGFLYIRRGVSVAPMMLGGEQERGLRAGTLDVPSVVALGAAAEEATADREKNNAHVKAVRNEFLRTLDCGAPVVCGRAVDDIVSVVFDGVNGGRLAVALSCAGVCCSVGSACSAGSAVPPRTLVEMGVKNADSSVRFSFGRGTTVEQAAKAARIVNDAVLRLKGQIV